MRVITGKAKGRKLIAPDGLNTRPTSDMVKESIFSVLQFDIFGTTVLDLFAGSGQLGIEALSRGAKSAVFVDSAQPAVAVIKSNLALTGFEACSRVNLADAFSFLKTDSSKFDIAFLDPPYSTGILQKILPELSAHISGGGFVVCEHERRDALLDEYGDLKLAKTYHYGKIAFTVFRCGEIAD